MRSGGRFDVEALKTRLAELDEQASHPELWQDPERAQGVQRERAGAQDRLVDFGELELGLDDIATWLELAADGEAEAIGEAARRLGQVEAVAARFELERMLSGEHDRNNAIVTIHAGAGGIDAQDWAEMLLRMYLRWTERRGFKVEVVEETPGEGAGIKSCMFTVEGEYAYGNLRAEVGVHRLVRISPFDANSRRQTSFAAVLVTPEVDETINIEILDDDLRVDTYRSSGAGGQHVNKTDSAVRLTHLPSGVVVACQNERSQHKNRATAMKILRAKLYELEVQKLAADKEKLIGVRQKIDFGSQIRSYVLQPYRMVKDLRSGHEVGNADAVLDGDLDGFIEAELLRQAGMSAEG